MWCTRPTGGVVGPFFMILWLLIVIVRISYIFPGNCFQFQRNISSTGLCLAAHCQCNVGCAEWAFWQQNVVWVFSWMVQIYFPDLIPCHNFLSGYLKDTVYKKQSVHSQRTETRHFGSCDQHQWRDCRSSCVKFATSAANSHGHWRCTYWKYGCIIVSLLRLLNSETPNTPIFAM